MSRSSKYSQAMLTKAFAAAQNHATDKEIAAALGISERTFYDWLKKFPQFSQEIKRGKEITDDAVECALYKRALGYDYEEVETVVEVHKQTGDTKPIKVRKVTKHIAPDPTAAIIWLKHRRKRVWGDRVQDLDTEAESKVDALIEVMQEAARASLQPKAGPRDPEPAA